jgi:hypothetical protein
MELMINEEKPQAYIFLYIEDVYHPPTDGDERSRTNPGHGYPAQPGYTDKVPTYKICASYGELESLIRKAERDHKKYQVGEFNPVAVETEVKIVLK